MQAQQRQSSGLEEQSMKAGADQEGRQATGPEANDFRSASPCTPQRRPVSVAASDREGVILRLVACCHDLNSRSSKICWHCLSCRCCMLYILSVAITSCRMQVHWTSFPMYLSVPPSHMKMHLLPLLKTLTQLVTDKLNTRGSMTETTSTVVSVQLQHL